jgi:glycine amidinotransferase
MDMVTRAHGSDAALASRVSPVNSHNEWDPLEEVIVGRLEGATIPSGHPVVTCNIPGMAARAQSLVAGWRFPKIMIEPAQRCVVAVAGHRGNAAGTG